MFLLKVKDKVIAEGTKEDYQDMYKETDFFECHNQKFPKKDYGYFIIKKIIEPKTKVKFISFDLDELLDSYVPWPLVDTEIKILETNKQKKKSTNDLITEENLIEEKKGTVEEKNNKNEKKKNKKRKESKKDKSGTNKKRKRIKNQEIYQVYKNLKENNYEVDFDKLKTIPEINNLIKKYGRQKIEKFFFNFFFIFQFFKIFFFFLIFFLIFLLF
jgi:hypothetical protein